MNTLQKGLGLSVLALLSACSSGTPGCADEDATGLLREIVEEHFLESAYGRQLRPMVEYSIRGIRTEQHDNKLDSYECSATLEFHLVSNPNGPTQSRTSNTTCIRSKTRTPTLRFPIRESRRAF
ncbi:hypothetical protein [Ectopseudomonas mendocina]|uniref:hypothetical protein n=1 Tax=Ectopseudomonas mendocina TaxID=300 RepID=UPI000206E373|nr:hypothetical protein [Pseudomonas mendocina]AEB60493.1 hypothetical protein MDS_4462 [Pseudomonas mendocina NK-01]